MSHRDECPTKREAERQGERAQEWGRSRSSNPHESFWPDEGCPEAAENRSQSKWQVGLAGHDNIITFDGDDIAGVGYAPQPDAIIAKHNRGVDSLLAERALLLDQIADLNTLQAQNQVQAIGARERCEVLEAERAILQQELDILKQAITITPTYAATWTTPMIAALARAQRADSESVDRHAGEDADGVSIDWDAVLAERAILQQEIAEHASCAEHFESSMNELARENIELRERAEAAESQLSACRALIEQWRTEGARIDGIHATMGIGYKQCADDLSVLLRGQE